MPKVSIIIPLYNPGLYIRDALLSVISQTYEDFEIVLIDDASKEDLTWITSEFPTAKFITQDHGGASIARNNGILNSSGEYISFMDQDDVWLPDKLARQVATLESDASIGICYCDLQLIDENGATINSAHNKDTDLPVSLEPVIELDGASNASEYSPMYQSITYFSKRFVVPSTVMMRRSCLSRTGLLDPFIPFCGDFDLIIKIGSNFKVARLPRPEVLYRKHEKNFSLQYEVCKQEIKHMVAKYSIYGSQHGDEALARDAKKLFSLPAKIYAAQAYDRCRQSVKKGDMPSVLKHLTKAFTSDPVYVSKSIAKWIFLRIAPSNSR
jgi:glycosyltransferase involved in cell wall biosynthesis